MRLVRAAVLLSLLAACGTALPEGEPVPLEKVLLDTRLAPWECADYDPASDSCTILALREVRGGRLFYDARGLMEGPEGQPMTMRMKVDFAIEGDRFCGDMREAEIRFEGDLSPGTRGLMEELLLAELLQSGEMCNLYYRDAEGYLGVTTDRAGQVLPDGVERLHFFSAPKRLRLF